MFAQIENGKLKKYPYTLADLKTANPSTSFPLDPLKSAELREYFDIVEVGEKSKPEYSDQTHKCIEKKPELKNGKWSQIWETKAKTSNEKTQDDSK